VKVHQFINSHSLKAGGAERLVRGLHLGLLQYHTDSRLVELLRSEAPPQQSTSLTARSLYSLFALWQVLGYCRSQVAAGDVVHAHLSPTLFYCALAKRLLRKPFQLVITEHNSHNNRRGSWLGRILDRFLYSTVDRIVCISEGTRDVLVQWMPQTEAKNQVIYNGIPLHFQQIPLRPPRARLRILSVGRLHQQKNYRAALDAFALLCDQLKASASPAAPSELPEYWIAGTGELEAELKAHAHTRGISHQVQFLGHVADIPQLLAEADLFLIPSLWEGFGLAAVEAMNAGLPIIASEVPGLSELMIDDAGRASGLLINPELPGNISDALWQLCTSTQLRERLGSNGFARAAVFSEEKMIDAHLRLYRSFSHS
jgi:glycosyltransferase involved in cell wall biosynthesis